MPTSAPSESAFHRRSTSARGRRSTPSTSRSRMFPSATVCVSASVSPSRSRTMRTRPRSPSIGSAPAVAPVTWSCSPSELGHITLDLNGPPCQGRCPGRGHLEALASGTAADGYAREAAERNPEGDLGRAARRGMTVDARLAVELAANGPGDARDVLDHVGLHLGVGIATFVNVFNPELVVLGGGFARAGDLLFEPARQYVAEHALSPARDEVKIVPALLGVEAGLIGAGLAGFEALHRES